MAEAGTQGSITLDLEDLRRFGTFTIASAPFSRSVQCNHIEGVLEFSATAHLAVAEDTHLLMVVEDGGSCICCPRNRRAVAHGGSVAFAQGPQTLELTLGAGNHRAELYWWGSATTPHIEAWLRNLEDASSPGLAIHAIEPELAQVVERMRAGESPDVALREMQFLSAAYELVPNMVGRPNSLRLTSLSDHLPEGLVRLVARVTGESQRPWSLRDSATVAGFSTFHFSRVFKSHAGYGFPEYLDRLRTQRAVELLCLTALTLPEILAQTGLLSTQALRESLVEYLGLSPLDIRPR